jgi:hypothetical protein
VSQASAAFKSGVRVRGRKLEPDKAIERLKKLNKDIHEWAEPAIAKAFPDLWSHLTQEGQDRLVEELLAAFASKPRGSAKSVLEAWYRTIALRQDPDRERHVREAGQIRSEHPISSSEELRVRIGL